MTFEEQKSKILKDYNVAINSNLIDQGMILINQQINNHNDFITTSSCTGRTIIISKSDLRSKYQTEFHFKTHNPEEIKSIELNEINFDDELWMLVESPNIHVKCRNFESAKLLHQLSLSAKLSKSKFQSIDPSIIVEILGTGSLQVPVGIQSRILINTEHWEFCKTKARELLIEEQRRLKVFSNLLNQ